MLCMVATVQAGGMKSHGKPRSPLQVSITPIQSGLSASDDKTGTAIRPGEVINLRITGKSFADVEELNIQVELYGGVELVSGETSWSGPARKGDDKTLLITVRATVLGDGGVRARISTPPSSGAAFTAEAEYRLGQNALKKPAQPKMQKDHKGREIREYRAN